MAIELALVIVALALPGLVWGRSGSRVGRGLALVAMAGVVVAVFDLPREILSRSPARVAVVPTTGAEPDRQLLRRVLGADVEVAVEAGAASVDDRLGLARLRGRRDPYLVTLFTGRLARDRPGGGAVARFDVLSARQVAPLDPERVVVRASTVAAAGRPAVLEVLLGPAAGAIDALRGRLIVRDPAGVEVLDQTLTGQPTQRIEWRPAVAGAHAVEFELATGAADDRIQWRGAGTVRVVERSRVTVVGRDAAVLAQALAVQEIAAQPAAALPADLDGTLVLLDPLSRAEQQRVATFVAAGGGVFLVGAEGGGGVPDPAEPLGAIAPVIRLPLPPVEKRDGGKGRGETATPPDDPPVAPPKDPAGKQDPPKTPDDKATGDTRGARTKIEEREVERRQIAMVLLVDRSASMGASVTGKGRLTKMDIAKASAFRTAQGLDAGDELAVVSFGAGSSVVLPLRSVENREDILRKLEELRVRQEPTQVRTALGDARTLLEASKAPVKHVVIITDGAIHDAGKSNELALSVARKFFAEKTGITLSLVLAAPTKSLDPGDGANARRLVALGNGIPAKDAVVYQTESFDRVPKLLSTEVERVRTDLAGRRKRDRRDGDPPDRTPPPTDPPVEPPTKAEHPEEPPPKQPEPPRPERLLEVHAVTDSELLAPELAPGRGYPGVAGVLPSESRADALTLLAVEDGTPLLAFANRGLGRIGAWTADLVGPWGAAWAADSAFPGRLAQWIRFLAPPRSAGRALDVVRRPAVTPTAVPLPRDATELRQLGGSAVRPLESFVPPSADVTTTVVGRAPDHAALGFVLLLLLAVAEFLLWRRPTLTS